MPPDTLSQKTLKICECCAFISAQITIFIFFLLSYILLGQKIARILTEAENKIEHINMLMYITERPFQ